MKTVITAVIILACLLSVVSTNHANAQTTYTIPLERVTWDHYRITVKIDPSPNWVYESVVHAMMNWNQAQVWFRTSYHNSRGMFNLTNSPSATSPDISVVFTQKRIHGEHGGICAYRASNGVITSVRITLYISLPQLLLYTAEHEFGHALGLGHSNHQIDIMNPSVNVGEITTLDLYGISREGTQAVAVLPSSIPYSAVPDMPVPEFPFTLITVFSLTASMLLLLKVRQRRPPALDH